MANEKRLIDANNLLERILSLTLTVTGLRNGKGVLFELLNKYRNGILQLVNEQPTVDAVEVVRCKDCLWFDNEDELPDVFRSEQHCYCTEANTYVPINHFCSYGERRTNA